MFPTRGDPYQNRPTDSRSRPHQDNPFDDSNYTRLPPSWQGGIHAQESGGSYISRTGQAVSHHFIIFTEKREALVY